MRVKAVSLVLNDALPEDLRDYQRKPDAKNIGRIMHMVAMFHPEKYADVAQKIGDIGRDAAYWQGETIGLDDLEDPIDTKSYLKDMDQKEAKLQKELANDPEGFAKAREALWHRTASRIESDSMAAALKKNNAIGLAVASGARGKPLQLRAMLSTPAVFADSKDRTIPIFARSSYSAGISPAEFLAATYGARKSVIATKRATAKGGFLSKVLGQNANNLIVTEEYCGTNNGIDIDANDPGLKLRFLAQDAAGLKSGDLLDRKAVARLADRHKGKLLVRSALTCESKNGVCAKCIGADPRGHLFPIGYAAGSTAGQAIGEPITQGALNTKHVGGAASSKRNLSGFDVINRFVQVPEEFPDKAPVAEESGKVTVKPAAQGGNYVYVGDTEHYVPAGFDLKVKSHDEVEKGDALSEGLVRPDDIVRLRGLGSGRRYYAERLGKILDDSGMPPDPRNVELIARAAINHVRIDDPELSGDGVIPDDVVPYSSLSHNITPPDDAMHVKPAAGMTLYAPALHYTIGTQLTPRMAERLNKAGISKVFAGNSSPGFTPVMGRLQTATHANPDWFASLNTSYLQKQVTERAMRGQDTNIEKNINFAPRLAVGVDFGKDTSKTGMF